jgi:hypothetical protein
MAADAESLPVLNIPEQLLISTVRDDVIYCSGRLDSSFVLAVLAQRMLS